MNEFSYYNYFQIFGTVCEIPVAVNFQNKLLLRLKIAINLSFGINK